MIGLITTNQYINTYTNQPMQELKMCMWDNCKENTTIMFGLDCDFLTMIVCIFTYIIFSREIHMIRCY